MSRSAEPGTYDAAASVRAFLAQAVLWNIALFAVIRLPWVDTRLVSALVDFQTTLIFWYGARPASALVVTSSCSGAGVAALCLAATLSYPVAWRRRLAGAAVGVAVIIGVNVIRIATLFAVASSSRTLNLLHVYVWPAVLAVTTLLYIWLWIRWSERRTSSIGAGWGRFFRLSLAGLTAYAVVVPWAFSSTALQVVCGWTASAGGALMDAFGAHVQATGAVLVTGRGAFQVTPECLFSPVVPLYFAAVFSMPLSRARRLGWIALAAPLFFVLGVTRLLVLALPAFLVDRPTVFAHGFYQLMIGAVVIVAAAHLACRYQSRWASSRRTAIALGAAALALGIGWNLALLRAAHVAQAIWPATLTSLSTADDEQGALVLLPAFQVGLTLGLWIALTGGRGKMRLARGLAVIALTQVALLAVLGFLASRGVHPHALVLRGWAIGLPIALAARWALGQGTITGDRAYRRFWHDVGDRFPVLTGAASTSYYRANEERLIAEALPALADSRILKTDLWDEAKNTRIMQWAADRGARVFGIDISEPIVRQARQAFGSRRLRPAVSDVRRLPFADDSFDAIYSMGTVEHFVETEASVAELARILEPGGRLILGVPNRHDPFLRPLVVAVLYNLGLYAYGFEKSYSRGALRRMVEAAGLRVRMETGILFIPGWLRMLDLWCHTRARPLAAVTGRLVQPFVWLDARFPSLRRHGYLIVAVAEKPARQASADGVSASRATHAGTEYMVDAHQCDPRFLQSLPRLQRLFDEIVGDLALQPIAPAAWHVFPGHAGITGVVLLAESHLTVHTYPETGLAAINLYCCRPTAEWPWEARLRESLHARAVTVRELRRGA